MIHTINTIQHQLARFFFSPVQGRGRKGGRESARFYYAHHIIKNGGRAANFCFRITYIETIRHSNALNLTIIPGAGVGHN